MQYGAVHVAGEIGAHDAAERAVLDGHEDDGILRYEAEYGGHGGDELAGLVEQVVVCIEIGHAPNFAARADATSGPGPA